MMRCLLLCAVLCAVVSAAAPEAPVFAFANLDFETDADGDGWPDGWTDDAGGQASRVEIVNGDHVLRIEGDGGMRQVRRRAAVPAGVDRVCVSAMVRLRDFRRGANQWDDVRIAFVFLNAAGEGMSYPTGINLNADTDWRLVEAVVSVPDEAVELDLLVIMHGSHGVLEVDDIVVEDVQAGESSVDTTGWIEYGADTLTTAGTMADLSRLNEKPAGLHGFLHVEGGQFRFEDGTGPFRLWGAAIAGSTTMPDKERAEQIAGRLAAMGVNCVRLHHIENTWSGPTTLIDYDAKTADGKPTSRVLNPEMLDRLHYFTAKLKEHGIYIYLDLITSRRFQEGDGCPIHEPGDRGMDCKGVIGHPAVRELLKEFNRKLLTTRNAYTGLAPVEDPAFVLSEVINEDDLALDRRHRGDEGPYGEHYRARFNEWLDARYGSRDRMLAAWRVAGEESPLLESEDPLNVQLAHSYGLTTWGRVAYGRYRPGSPQRRFMHRDEDRLRFWDHVQREAWADVIEHARGLGYEVPMTGSNMPGTHLHSRAANVDLGAWLDEHSYFDLGGWQHYRNDPIRNVNELTVPPAALGLKAMMAPADHPFTLSEWNTGNDIDTAYVHVPHYAYRMAFHGWAGGNHFAYGWGEGPDRAGPLSMEQHAGLIGQWPIAALMLRRGDLTVGEARIIEFPREKVFDFDYHSGGSGQPLPWGGIDPRLSAVENIRTRFVDRAGEPVVPDLDAALIDEEGKVMVSSTGQVLWDWGRGALFINTPRTVWAAGEFGGGVEQIGPVTFELESPGASIAVTSLDDERPITESGRLLIMAVGRAYATGAVYNRTRTYVKKHGSLPLVAEPVRADLRIELPGAQSVELVAYTPDGQRADPPPHTLADGVLHIALGDAAHGIYYGVVVQRHEWTRQRRVQSRSRFASASAWAPRPVWRR